MSPYHWTTCPASIRNQVLEALSDITGLLGRDCVGTYLHGSLAMSSFNPASSDVDLLIVNEEPLAPVTRAQLAHTVLAHSNSVVPLELHVLEHGSLYPWEHPAPFEFHYGEDWRERFAEQLESGGLEYWEALPTTDVDLAAHITVVNERGITLSGEPARKVFPQIPEEDYVHSILTDIVWAQERMEVNPVYFILNACRVYAYLCQRRVYSKSEAGLWARDMVPREHSTLIQEARTSYRSSQENGQGPTFDQEELQAFALFILDEIRRFASPYDDSAHLLALMKSIK
jgi:streptomycin 3"-adenylyltransferase